jgi:hypothetical protein
MPLCIGADKFHGHGVTRDGGYKKMGQLACVSEEKFAAGHCAQREAWKPRSASKICKKKKGLVTFDQALFGLP